MQHFHRDIVPDRTYLFYLHNNNKTPFNKRGRRLTAISYAIVVWGGKAAVGSALCSKADQFVKKVAREMAVGRALKALSEGVTVKAPQNVKEADVYANGYFRHFVKHEKSI